MVQEYEGGLFAIYVLGGLNMNVKEIAQAVGKTERTVHNWIEKVSAKIAQVSEKVAQAKATSKPADYTIDETIAIIEQGMGKNAAAIFRENAGNKPKEIDNRTDIAFISGIVAETIKQLWPLLNNQNQQGNQPVKQITENPPEMSLRNKLNQIVRDSCDRTSEPYGQAWTRLYKDICYRFEININVRSKNLGITPIEYLEQEGLLEKAIICAQELFGQ